MCWIPKSDDDLEFAPMEHKFVGNKTDKIEVADWYSTANEHDAQIEENGAMKLQIKQLNNINDKTLEWVNV